jgi:hypothetical protein
MIGKYIVLRYTCIDSIFIIGAWTVVLHVVSSRARVVQTQTSARVRLAHRVSTLMR